MSIPYLGGLAPNQHCTLDTAPMDVLATLGPLLQRINIAVKAIPGVARTHFARWGDGSEHFHMWALARPEGMMQGRGAMLAFWDDVLPEMPPELQDEHLRIVAESLAAGGGTAFPHALMTSLDGQLVDRLEAVLVVPLLADLDEGKGRSGRGTRCSPARRWPGRRPPTGSDRARST